MCPLLSTQEGPRDEVSQHADGEEEGKDAEELAGNRIPALYATITRRVELYVSNRHVFYRVGWWNTYAVKPTVPMNPQVGKNNANNTNGCLRELKNAPQPWFVPFVISWNAPAKSVE